MKLCLLLDDVLPKILPFILWAALNKYEPLEVVGRGSDTQFQVGPNLNTIL